MSVINARTLESRSSSSSGAAYSRAAPGASWKGAPGIKCRTSRVRCGRFVRSSAEPEPDMAKKTKSPTEITSTRHKNETRVNIPTEELRDFVSEDEKAPKAMLYPRDPSLDPQLVWRGKDEQDASALEVPVVPIYIQEKVHPQALVENLRDTAKKGEQEPELSLFADFNGITDFDKKVDFYHHEGHWSNRMI